MHALNRATLASKGRSTVGRSALIAETRPPATATTAKTVALEVGSHEIRVNVRSGSAIRAIDHGLRCDRSRGDKAASSGWCRVRRLYPPNEPRGQRVVR